MERRIIKENLEELILPLANKVLHIFPIRLEEIPDDLQLTLERKPDFLKKVIMKGKEEDYILHIEFQVKNEPRMVHRMLTYFALLNEQYEMDVKQYVVYIGRSKPTMKTELQRSNTFHRFILVNMQVIEFWDFIASSTKPEEAVLAVLTNFKKPEAKKVISEIIEKIRALSKSTSEVKKFVKQLEILSNLRNLQELTIKITEAMSITYNIEKDIRYQQGIERGIERGIEKGFEKGSEQEKTGFVQRLLLETEFTMDKIASLAKVSVAFVKKVKKELERNG